MYTPVEQTVNAEASSLSYDAALDQYTYVYDGAVYS